MSTNFPTSLDSLTNPTSGDSLNSPSHADQHTNANDAIEALEAKVGINSSAVTTSHDYKLSGVTGSDKAVSKTGTETLTNKTLTAPQINMGSDATGDMYYRNGSGVTTRLAIGSSDQILSVQSGIPAWIANPSAVDASYSAKGIVKFDTDAATSGVTVTAGVATLNTGTTANKIVKLDASAKLPAVDGSALTNIPAPASSSGTTTKNAADASATQTIAHGLGRVPKSVEIRCTLNTQITVAGSGVNRTLFAHAFYNGTTQSSQSHYATNNSEAQTATFTLNAANASDTTVGVITVDSTNISIAWTKTGSPTGTYNILWFAQ